MSDHGSNRPPGSRALEAIAEAARRSREATMQGSSGPSSAHDAPHMVGPASDPAVDGRSPARAASDRCREMRLVTAVIVVALVLIIVTATLVVSEVTLGGSRTAPRSVTTRTTTARPPLAPSSNQPTPVAPTTARPASTTPTSSVEGSDPVLSSLTPSSGEAGQSVVISGANFLSANGQILVRFGGQVAPTRCSGPTSCSVTVPVLAGPPSAVPVTVTTVLGTSNALNFVYG